MQNPIYLNHLLPPRLQPYAFPAAVAVLVILHAVGLWGLLWSGRPEVFQRLTPFNLLVSNVLLLLFHRDWRLPFVVFAIVTAAAGFLAEVLGVHTGLIFGHYTYGEALGLKLWEVPLLIGLNWFMLVYCTGVVAQRLQVPVFLRVMLAALLMVLLDFLIEPVAVRYDFWSWSGSQIPVSNYAGWLVVALLLQVLFAFLPFGKENNFAPWLLGVQLLFFLALNLLMSPQ